MSLLRITPSLKFVARAVLNISVLISLLAPALALYPARLQAARHEGDPPLPPTFTQKIYLPLVNTPAHINRGVAELPATLALPPGFVSELLVSGLDLPTAIAFGPDKRLFIAEKNGVLRVWHNNALQPAAFINLSAEVNSARDRGLLGVAVHPQFPVQPYVYVLFAYDPPGVKLDGVGARVIRLLRITADPERNFNVALADSSASQILLGKNSTRDNIGNENENDDTELVACQKGSATKATSYINDCVPADSAVHSTGGLRFGPDGMLYVSIGDNAIPWQVDPRALRAQVLDSLAGKLLRIDPLTGTGLRDNPFFDGNANSNRSKVLNYGLRNPFRFTFKPGADLGAQPVIGDIGWNTAEEINIGRGKNFGWPCYEGNSKDSEREISYANDPRTSPMCNILFRKGSTEVQKPSYAYNTLPEGGAIMLGDFYTGTAYPAAYRASLFFADYERQWIKYANFDATGNMTVTNFGSNVGAVVDMLAGPEQDLYYVLIGQQPTGEVRRIRYAGVNVSPSASAAVNLSAGPIPLAVQFSSAGSAHPAGLLLNYAWDFGDSSSSTEANPSKTYTRAGQYRAKLIVTDSAGQRAETSVVITAGGQRPILSVQSPKNGSTYWVGDSITLAAIADDAEDGDISANIRWQVVQYHNEHAHYDAYTVPNGPSASFVVADHGNNTHLQVCATVADSTGVAALPSCVTLRPETSQYSFESEPPGLQVLFEGVSRITPFSIDAIINSHIEIGVTESQKGLNFVGWDDGGSRVRNLVIENVQRKLLARYSSPNPPASGPQTTPITVTAPSGGNPCAGNLLSNGDFENGLASWNASGPIAKIVADSHGGKNALWMEITTGSIGQNIVAQPYLPYTLRGWGKVTDGTVAQVGINYFDAKWNRLDQTVTDIVTLEYNEFSLPAPAPANTAMIEVWIYKNPDGNVWLDDLCLTR